MAHAQPPIKPAAGELFVWQRHSFSGRRWPRSRVVRSFLQIVPWIDLALAALLIYCLLGKTVVQPGHVVRLPAGETAEGLQATCPAAVVKRLMAPGREQVTVLLLEEGRYTSDNPTELEALERTRPGRELNLMVDDLVPYGEALRWVERLRRCGAERLNLVLAEPGQAESEERK